MGDRRPLVAFYHGHSSLVSDVPHWVYLVACVVFIFVVAVIWAHVRRKARRVSE